MILEAEMSKDIKYVYVCWHGFVCHLLQVVYSNFEKVGQQEVPKPAKAALPQEEEDDDDLDIDDI